MTALAATIDSEMSTLQDIVTLIRSENPSAQVSIENGVVNVYINDTPQTMAPSSNIEVMASPTTIYAPAGGMWTSFIPPLYTAINPDSHVMPYCVVFLPAEKANALYVAMTTTGFMDFILNHPLVTYGAETITAMILAQFGIAMSTTSVIFLYTNSMIYLYDTVNVNSLANAIGGSSGGKVRIDYTTLAGWPVNYYYSWTGDNVTNSPYQDFEPVFHHAIYSPSDL